MMSKPQMRSLSVSLLKGWGETAGHNEDYSAPNYYFSSSDGTNWSVAEVFQALAFSLERFEEGGSLPDRVSVSEVLGPIDYPMYDLKSPLMMDGDKFRGGWLPPEMPLEDFPDPDILLRQGLPAQFHGAYSAKNEPENVFEAVNIAAAHIREKEYIPAVIPITLASSGGGTQSPDPTYCNPAELLYTMAHLYWQINTKGSPRMVIMGSTRIILDQNHLFVAVTSPVTFTRSTYRFRKQSFDWIEKVPLLRIQSSWTYRP